MTATAQARLGSSTSPAFLGLVDRYLLKEILQFAGLGLGVFLFILLTPEVLRLSELLAPENVALPQAARLLLSSLPAKLMWAIPLGVLAGLLMGLSRAAADCEVVALQAAGIGPLRLLRPVMVVAGAGAVLTLATTVWWGPAAARAIQRLQRELASGQISYEVKPRVFDERLPGHILYIQDSEGGAARWRGVFLANLSQPANPVLIFAEEGVAVPDPEHQVLRLHLARGSTHSLAAAGPERYTVSTFLENVLVIPLSQGSVNLEARQHALLSMSELWRASQAGERWRSARADFHRRLALPGACVAFGLIALPLGLLAERSGRAIGFVAAVGVAFSYYLVFLLGDRLGREGSLPPSLGVWLANLLLLLPVVYYLCLYNRIGGGERLLAAMDFTSGLLRHLFRRKQRLAPQQPTSAGSTDLGSSLVKGNSLLRLPRTLDLYVARGVLFHFSLLVCSLLLVFALFTVLEMVDDIAAHKIPWVVVARFLWYLLPQASYWLAPLALLLAVLVELAVLSKRNELIAIKGAGISLYRIALPLLALGLAAAAFLFWLDSTYLPRANQRQEILRNQIKGRPAQTFFQAERRWLYGEVPRIYHYAYFDATNQLLGEVSVLDFNREPFSLARRLYARQGHWDTHLQAWVLEEGWERVFTSNFSVHYHPFVIESHPELTEPPAYFRKEVRESAQMNWRELAAYMGELEQSGFNVTPLEVQWHKKFAYPLMAGIMVLLAFPFGMTMGKRGAVGGLALGMALGFLYWVLSGFLESLGNLGLLPTALAAWGPGLIFLFAGAYLFLRIET